MALLDQISHLARLAKLSFNEEELPKLASQCEDILNYMDMLSEIDTAKVQPLYSPMEQYASRADQAESKGLHKAVLANAPESDNEFFKVPRIV